jgi:CBS-domain-containing membrane protein
MNSAIERLLSLRVADVMAKDVFHVSANETMEQAAVKMVDRDISGAPVVNELQQCVGVLSATDFLRFRVHGGNGHSAGDGHVLQHGSPEAPFQIDRGASDHVHQHMSAAVQTISADATLMQAGREMCVEHVHRLPVLDATGAVVGLISSLDIVAAMVNAVEE